MLEKVAIVNQAVTLPMLKQKTGMDVVSHGQDLGEIVTVADLKISQYLLNGGLEGVIGARQDFPGSFSEEDDTALRLGSTEIWQIDPMDGTGDTKATYQTDNVIGPTTLVSFLARDDTSRIFTPKCGMIFDIISGIAIISDGKEIQMSVVQGKKIKDVQFEIKDFNFQIDAGLRINKRETYPQENFDQHFIDELRSKGIKVEQIPVGGAGTIAMQFFRNYIEVTSDNAVAWNKLKDISLIFNAQPDHKTWDFRPTQMIAQALNLPEGTDIYGKNLMQNENAPELKDMHYTTGYVVTPDLVTRTFMTSCAQAFEWDHPGLKLTVKNY